MGWKGELTFFKNVDGSDKASALTASTGIDYSFGKGWFIYTAYLFNSDTGEDSQEVLLNTRLLTARNLFPYKHSLLTQISYPISPLLSISNALVFSFHDDLPLIISPSIKYSLSENWDLDFIVQSFQPLHKNSALSAATLLFLRIRWSF